MERKLSKGKSGLPVVAAALGLWFLEFFFFIGVGEKTIILLVGLLTVAMLLLRDVRRLFSVSTLLWAAYVAFAGLTAVWAMSGKFFLREYPKQFLAFCVFLYIMLKPTVDRAFVRRVLRVIALMAAWLAVLSVEAASTGLVEGMIQALISGYETLNLEFTSRLSGIYGNANVEASIYALGILAGLACMASAESKTDQIVDTVLCSLNAFAFLLCISLGATMCFALAVVVYLIVAGRDRVYVLLRMLFVAVPTLVFAVVSVPFFNGSAALKLLPLLFMAANAAVSVLLELRVMSRLSAVMEKHAKLPFVVLLSLVAVVAVYLIAAVNFTGPFTFSAEKPSLSRADYTAAGTHTVTVEADGAVRLLVESQSRRDVMLNEFVPLENQEDCAGERITFTVPESSVVCFYTVYAEPGVTVSSISIDGAASLPLQYKLLPDFVARRLQGAWASSSLIIRQALWDYGMRLFRLSPVIGNGYGAFETGISRVEDFAFQSKYVHNHYIEVLLCTGVIGFGLYVSALISMAVLLVKKRKFGADEELGWVYPMLVSVFVMVISVTLWDIVMSRTIYAGMVFAFFGLLIRLLGTPLLKEKTADAALSKKEKAAWEQRQNSRALLLRGAWAVLPVVFLLSLCGNMVADNLVNRQVTSYEQFFGNLKTAAEIDAYEYNDAKISYVLALTDDVELYQQYQIQADQYAEELLQVQSNSIPRLMEEFYLATGQYEMAIEAAKKSAVYSAADPDTWNYSFVQLWAGVILTPEALAENFETLLPELVAYKEMLDQRNATALDVIELQEPALSAYNVIAEMDRLEQEQGTDAAKTFLQELLDDIYKAVEEDNASGQG